jgi:ribA/ribD-fused uncharacterized protein
MALKLLQFRDPQLAIPQSQTEKVTRVGFYPREFYPLDNFSAFQVDWRGQRFATSEHAYQWAKFVESAPEIAELIAAARSPHEAQKLARLYKDRRRTGWADVKVDTMVYILRHKLEQNPYVVEKLLQTLDLEIIEDSPKDSFWGWGPNRDGRNELGKIWMRLRKEIQAAD